VQRFEESAVWTLHDFPQALLRKSLFARIVDEPQGINRIV
jgi:hypothetical protein